MNFICGVESTFCCVQLALMVLGLMSCVSSLMGCTELLV